MSKHISTVTITLDEYAKLKNNERALEMSDRLYDLACEAMKIETNNELYEWKDKVDMHRKVIGKWPSNK